MASRGSASSQGPVGSERLRGLSAIERLDMTAYGYQDVPFNSTMYACLASTIDVGLRLLETRKGRDVLEHLGRRLVDEWPLQANTGVDAAYYFRGNPARMRQYVDHFLDRVRHDFPKVAVDYTIANPDQLAMIGRSPQWAADLDDFIPPYAGMLHFNGSRFADVVRNSDLTGRSGLSSAERLRVSNRHKEFIFMFAVSAAHELCHFFVGYLGLNEETSFTPPTISYLDYHMYQYRPDPNDLRQTRGESGRWFERQMYGGSLEWYYFQEDGPDQPGRAHVLDEQANARRIPRESMILAIASPAEFTRTFRPSGRVISEQDRKDRGIRSIGCSQGFAGPSQFPGMAPMLARDEGPVITIPGEQLLRAALEPGVRFAIRVR